MRQRVARHEPAVAPPVNADARTVDPQLLLQPPEAVFDVAQLELAKALEDRPRRLDALAARRPVVADPDDDAFLREELVIQVVRAAPGVAHERRVRAPVRELIHGIPARRVEVGRLDHHGLHDEAVPCFHLDELRL